MTDDPLYTLSRWERGQVLRALQLTELDIGRSRRRIATTMDRWPAQADAFKALFDDLHRCALAVKNLLVEIEKEIGNGPAD